MYRHAIRKMSAGVLVCAGLVGGALPCTAQEASAWRSPSLSGSTQGAAADGGGTVVASEVAKVTERLRTQEIGRLGAELNSLQARQGAVSSDQGDTRMRLEFKRQAHWLEQAHALLQNLSPSSKDYDVVVIRLKALLREVRASQDRLAALQKQREVKEVRSDVRNRRAVQSAVHLRNR